MSLDEKRSSADRTSLDKGLHGTTNLEDVIRDIDTGEINELSVVAEGEERTTWFVWILVLCSTISGLLFGLSLR
jgi:SP family myo-inositol transporter-like MFS transporter 13